MTRLLIVGLKERTTEVNYYKLLLGQLQDVERKRAGLETSGSGYKKGSWATASQRPRAGQTKLHVVLASAIAASWHHRRWLKRRLA